MAALVASISRTAVLELFSIALTTPDTSAFTCSKSGAQAHSVKHFIDCVNKTREFQPEYDPEQGQQKALNWQEYIAFSYYSN